MKLSDSTISVLSNFSMISGNVFIPKGSNVVSVWTEAKNIIGSARLDETFDEDFGVYNLSQFLKALNLVGGREIDFEGTDVVIHSGSRKMKYRLSNESNLHIPPRQFNLFADSDPQQAFQIGADEYANIAKAASLFQSSRWDIAFGSEGGAVRILGDDGNQFDRDFGVNPENESNQFTGYPLPLFSPLFREDEQYTFSDMKDWWVAPEAKKPIDCLRLSPSGSNNLAYILRPLAD